MARKTSDWAWKAGFAAAICGAVVAAITGLLAQLWAIVKSATEASLIHLAATSLWPNWLVYILATFTVLVVCVLAYAFFRRDDVEHALFTQFVYKGALWRWRLIDGQPDDPWCFCQSCDGVLVYGAKGDGIYSHNKTTFHCEHCNRQVTELDGTMSEAVAAVRREIQRQIRTGQWRSHVPAQKQQPAASAG